MQLTLVETLGLLAAAIAAFMAGNGRVRFNIILCSVQSALVALAALLTSLSVGTGLFVLAAAMLLLNTIIIPYCLHSIANKTGLQSDGERFVPNSLAMYLSIIVIGMVLLTVGQFFGPFPTQFSVMPITASVSMLILGMFLMLIRQSAISRLMGFLSVMNGTYFLAITQVKMASLTLEAAIALEVIPLVVMGALMLSKDVSLGCVELAQRWRMAGVCFTLPLALAFVTAVFVCDNLEQMWMSVEALALLSGALVYFNASANGAGRAIVFLFQLGVSLAASLFGIILISVAGQSYFFVGNGLSIDRLLASAGHLTLPFFDFGFGMAVIGFVATALVFAWQSWRAISRAAVPALAVALALAYFTSAPAFVVWKLVGVDKAVHVSVSR